MLLQRKMLHLAIYFCSIGTLMGLSVPALGQRYGATLGFRWGKTHYGIAAQYRIVNNSTIEAMAMFNSREKVITGLYEYHRPLLFKWKSFNTYIGMGGHVGFYKNDTLNSTFTGLDGIVGVEYKFPLLPFTVCADFKPAFNFNHPVEEQAFQPQFAVAIRYVILTYRQQEKKKREKERKERREKIKNSWDGFWKKIF